jgi:hypothetical protein
MVLDPAMQDWQALIQRIGGLVLPQFPLIISMEFWRRLKTTSQNERVFD